MDKTLDDTTALITQCSPPKRRRSTFFERRDSLVPQNQQDIAPSCESDKERENKQYEEELTRYLEKLNEEKEKWKTELRDRKTKYKELKLQLLLTQSSSQKKNDYSLLTNEDMDFLNVKPNITRIIESTLDLNKKLKDSLIMYKNLKELDNTLLDFCEQKLDALQMHIFNNSSLGEFGDKT